MRPLYGDLATLQLKRQLRCFTERKLQNYARQLRLQRALARRTIGVNMEKHVQQF